MAIATIVLPDTVSEADARLLLAIKLFEVGRVSCGKAAEMAGLSKPAFMQSLGQQRVPVFNTAADDLVQDLANA
jgi:predicted HTH domain antitoxin